MTRDPARAVILYGQATMIMIAINNRLSRQPEFPRMMERAISSEELSQETRRLVRVGRKAMKRMERLKLLAHTLVR